MMGELREKMTARDDRRIMMGELSHHNAEGRLSVVGQALWTCWGSVDKVLGPTDNTGEGNQGD